MMLSTCKLQCMHVLFGHFHIQVTVTATWVQPNLDTCLSSSLMFLLHAPTADKSQIGTSVTESHHEERTESSISESTMSSKESDANKSM